MLFWKASGVVLGSGLSPATVLEGFAKAGRRASADVVALYACCNGMARGESDGRMFALWPLDQCLEDAVRYGPAFTPFADFLISSHEYCFHFESADRSSVYLHGWEADPIEVASSVEEFFALLVQSPENVHVTP